MTIEEQLLEATAAISGVTAERDDLRATVEKLTVGAASEPGRQPFSAGFDFSDRATRPMPPARSPSIISVL